MNKLLVQARATLGRLTSWVRAHRTAVIDHGKTALIVVLCLSAVVLAGKTGLFGGTEPLEALRDRFISASGNSSVSTGKEDYQETARPSVIAVSPETGTRYGAAFSNETDTMYDRFATCLGEALGSAGTPEAVNRTQWETALSGTGVFFDYVQDQSLLCIAAWQGTSVPGTAAGHSARRFFLSVQDNGVRLYYISAATGQAYRCTTALAKSTLESRMDAYPSNGAVFAFENEAYSALDGDVLIVPDTQEVRSLSVSNPGTPGSAEEIMQLFGMNHITATNYPESDGGRVYLDGDNTLRLGADGVISFERGAAQETPLRVWNGRDSLPDVVDALYQTTLKLMDGLGDAGIRLVRAEYDAPSETDTVSFGYYLDGMQICLSTGNAADYVVSRDQILQATVRLRQYHLTGETQTPLPGVQAAALVAATGGSEPIRVYRDNGDSVTVEWLSRRLP